MGYKDFLEIEEQLFVQSTDSKEKNGIFKDIVSWEMNNGNLKSARERILNANDIDDITYLSVLGNLEQSEMNFQASYKLFQDLLTRRKNSFTALYSLADIYKQLGEFGEAEAILKELNSNPNCYVKTLFGLINLHIIKGDFYEALRILNTIDVKSLSKQYKSKYRDTCFYVKYYLGMIKEEEFTTVDQQYGYKKHRIYESNEDVLLKHVKKHVCTDNNHGFDPELDLKQLIDSINEKIEDINCLYIPNASRYYFMLDNPVGKVHGVETNSVVGVSYMGKIITLYPVLVSELFNMEGNLNSKALKFKRIEGCLKR